MDSIDNTKLKFTSKLKEISSLKDLELLRVEYLGREGKINQFIKQIKTVSAEKRKEYGQKINELKTSIFRNIEKKAKELSTKKTDVFFDPTLPGKKYPKGSLHMTTLAVEEIARIFEEIGFVRASYPEVEWEQFAFEALNMPKGHPARDDFETFFIDYPEHPKYGKMLLTPHTSSGQIREMLRIKKALPAGRQAPIRMINIAKCYRPNWDSTHNPMFYQFEGLCIDKGINITHLKGTIDYFTKKLFGPKREIRLRPYHFQFTEPSFETDVSCGVCGGTGKCSVCKSGWLELGGAGMVHPNVLKAGGINPEIYTGWAFGFGPERCFMMKDELKLDDIRILYGGDIRFLEKF